MKVCQIVFNTARYGHPEEAYSFGKLTFNEFTDCFYAVEYSLEDCEYNVILEDLE